MINQYIEEKIRSHFSFQPTPQQAELIGALSEFVASPDADSVFLLKGCAGTGKTSVVSALIQMLGELRMPVVLLAPTGRAAKVLSSYSGRPVLPSTAVSIAKKWGRIIWRFQFERQS